MKKKNILSIAMKFNVNFNIKKIWKGKLRVPDEWSIQLLYLCEKNKTKQTNKQKKTSNIYSLTTIL